MDDLRDIDEDGFYQSVLPRLQELELVRQAKLKVYLWRRKIGIAAATILTPPCMFLDWLLLRWQADNAHQQEHQHDNARIRAESQHASPRGTRLPPQV